MTEWMAELEEAWREMTPVENFRLWLVTEPHDRFPAVLARNSLKLSYEAPPGVKKNLQQTYAAWPAEIFRGKNSNFGRLLFAAAWFHAVVQERRIFVPQGWSKFYEITDSDLAAARNVLERAMSTGSKSVPWDWIRGLLEQSVYGGRIDSAQDQKVLSAYLRQYFSDQLVSGRGFLPGQNLPDSNNHSDYLDLIHKVPEADTPKILGLAENIQRSWEKIASGDVLLQLRGEINVAFTKKGIMQWRIWRGLMGLKHREASF